MPISAHLYISISRASLRLTRLHISPNFSPICLYITPHFLWLIPYMARLLLVPKIVITKLSHANKIVTSHISHTVKYAHPIQSMLVSTHLAIFYSYVSDSYLLCGEGVRAFLLARWPVIL